MTQTYRHSNRRQFTPQRCTARVIDCVKVLSQRIRAPTRHGTVRYGMRHVRVAAFTRNPAMPCCAAPDSVWKLEVKLGLGLRRDP